MAAHSINSRWCSNGSRGELSGAAAGPPCFALRAYPTSLAGRREGLTALRQAGELDRTEEVTR